MGWEFMRPLLTNTLWWYIFNAGSFKRKEGTRNMPVLKCEELTKYYDKKLALQNINLELESGKIYGLIGRNGSGKTTLLSVMSNQSPSSAGGVTLDGEAIWENPWALEHICFARELQLSSESSLGKYTVKRYLKTAAAFLPHWDQEMAEMLLQRFALHPRDKLETLPQGMRSMLTVLVAVSSRAVFTFLDEPVAGLDEAARREIYQLLQEEHRETGRTFVISTHMTEDGAEVMEEVILMRKGKLLRKENTQKLLAHARYVTGPSEAVDTAVSGLECLSAETVDGSKGVTVLLKEGQEVDCSGEVAVQSMSLESLYTAVCEGGSLI
jgi:ABC-2 type transport system ATP-binding protein